MGRTARRAGLTAALLLVLSPAARSLAWDHGHHGHCGHHGYWGGPRVVVGFAPAWYWPRPYFPYPRRAWPQVSAPEEPQVWVERPAPADYWYYCESARDYYPRVSSCPEPWMKVVPEVPGP